MRFGSRSKSKPTTKASGAQAIPSPPNARSDPDWSPASSTSSFISVGVLMDQRERPEHVERLGGTERATRDELEELDDALDAMSLDGSKDAGGTGQEHANPSPDELFEAYTGYMEAIKASVAHGSRKPKVIKGAGAAKARSTGNAVRPLTTAPGTKVPPYNPYIRSMQDVIDKKRGNQSRKGRGKGVGNKAKATGVTRRLMEEVAVAKENMHLFNRLISVLPSSDVERQRLLKDFTKSREYLEKMSRFAATPGERGESKPAWDEHWVGCMV